MAYGRRNYTRSRRSRKRRGSRTQKLVIQFVGTPGGVIADPLSLGNKSLAPLKARF